MKEDRSYYESLYPSANRMMTLFTSLGLVFGALLNFLSQYLINQDDLAEVLGLSLMLVALAILIQVIVRLSIHHVFITHIISLVNAVTLPFIALKFEKSASVTVWAASFLFIVLSMVYINRTMMLYTAVSAIATEIYLWQRYPTVNVCVDSSDYFGRIGMILMFIGIIFIINRLYIAQLKENVQKMDKISSLYEEITASEEELKQQNEQLIEANRHIKQSETIYRLVSEASNDGIWHQHNTNGEVLYSSRWYDILGYSKEELGKIGDWHQLIHPDDKRIVEKVYQTHIEQKTDYYECTYRVKRKTGGYIWIKAKGKALFDENGKPVTIAGAHTDITVLKESEHKLHLMAYYDSLTELPNRQMFLENMDACIIHSEKDSSLFAVIMIDMDNFKNINDTMGHMVGDLFLQAVSERLSLNIDDEENVMLARMGGDEFAVMVYGDTAAPDRLTAFVEKLRGSFQTPFVLGNSTVYTSASFGVAVYPSDGTEMMELIKNADTAMYSAKGNGKNAVCYFNAEMKESVQKKMLLETQLRSAIERGEFHLAYQPQYTSAGRKLRGFEALIRWDSPTLGYVMPGDFIPVAEQTGLIVPIGEWVLRTACKTFREMQDKFGFTSIISVNISPVQLKDSHFADIVKNVIDETGLRPECLELEITESLFIDSIDTAIDILNKLKQFGIRISLDDFGTGYSSLSYLRMLPIDTLKIDRAFIRGVDNSGADREIVGSIISLVHNMKLDVIAEGVENDSQFQYLKDQNCDSIQGFLLGKPMVLSNIEKSIEENTLFDLSGMK